MAPAVVLVTSTALAHLPLAGMLAPLRVTAVSPAVCLEFTGRRRQAMSMWGWASAVRSSDPRLSVTATPVSAVPLLGLLMVSVSVVEPPDAILAAPKVLLMLGGCTADCTVNGALPVLPVPPLVEVTLPVTLVMAPAVVLVTSTVMAQLPLAGMLAPLRVTAVSPAV